jgi:hypothetical protein
MKHENALRTINKITNNKKIKSIINAVNDNQLKSKDWLIENLKAYITLLNNPRICVAAGWYCAIGEDLRKFTNNKIISFDKDRSCKRIGEIFNKDFNIKFQTKDIENFNSSQFDVIICSSCEHISQKTMSDFLYLRKKGSLVILQSNNYHKIEEHINCKNSLDEFIADYNFDKILYKGTLKLDTFERYMIIAM